jgi:hypothetical protein
MKTELRERTSPYLTVWQRQKDGSFKIFRNLAIPEDNSVRTVHGPG